MIDPTLSPESNHTPEPAGSTKVEEKGQKNSKTSGPRIVVRYGLLGQIGEFRNAAGVECHPGKPVVVRTERGVELGNIVCGINTKTETGEMGELMVDQQQYKSYLSNYRNKQTFRKGGKVLRAANEQDLIDYRHLRSTAEEAARFCQEKILELNLEMQVVKVEHLLGGEKIIFHFTAQSRVDFRSLVKQLASRFRTRIEMHQVGARDEAKLAGDYGKCGQQCCCKRFLKELKPVSIKMAKVQKATLDPAKISGRCNRLMCCLRYEDSTYTRLSKKLPKNNSWVRTDTIMGKVVETHILTQLVRIEKPGGAVEVIGAEDIIEYDLPQPETGKDEKNGKSSARVKKQAEENAAGTDNEEKSDSLENNPQKEKSKKISRSKRKRTGKGRRKKNRDKKRNKKNKEEKKGPS